MHHGLVDQPADQLDAQLGAAQVAVEPRVPAALDQPPAQRVDLLEDLYGEARPHRLGGASCFRDQGLEGGPGRPAHQQLDRLRPADVIGRGPAHQLHEALPEPVVR